MKTSNFLLSKKIRAITKIKIFCFLIIIFYLSACIIPLNPVETSILGIEEINTKNYEIGQKLHVSIGGPAISVKKYKKTQLKPLYMRATTDFEIKGSSLSVSANDETRFRIRGEVTDRDARQYSVLALKGSYIFNDELYEKDYWFDFLIDKNGAPKENSLYEGQRIKKYSFSITPSDLKFIPLERYLIDKNQAYLNFDFLYGGVHDDHIFFTYREFSKHNMSTPAYFQNVSYNINQKTVRFRNFEMVIHRATNEQIELTVISDGQKSIPHPSSL